MTTPHTQTTSPISRRRRFGRRNIAVTGALTAALLAAAALSASATAAHPAHPAATSPAAGAVVTCQGLGALTAISGTINQYEPTTIDRRGRAHVFFTVSASHVVLKAANGTKYRLEGIGYDYVVYPSKKVTGKVVTEREHFYFDVTGAHGVVGKVRFGLHTGRDQKPTIHDNSTCQLPNMT